MVLGWQASAPAIPRFKSPALYGGGLVALVQGQVWIVHVRLHWPVKQRRQRHLARFSARKLHLAV